MPPAEKANSHKFLHMNNNINFYKQHKFKTDAQREAFKIWNEKIDKNKLRLVYGQKEFRAIIKIYNVVSNFYKQNPMGKFFYNLQTIYEKYICVKFGKLTNKDKKLYYRFSDVGIQDIKKSEKPKLNEIIKMLQISFRHYKRAIEWLVKNNKIKFVWDEKVKRKVWLHIGLLKWLEFNQRKERVLKTGKVIKSFIFKCWKSIQKTLFPFAKELAWDWKPPPDEEDQVIWEDEEENNN